MGCTPSRVAVAVCSTPEKDASTIKQTPKIDEGERLHKIPATSTIYAGVFVGCLLIRFVAHSCHALLMHLRRHC